MEWARAAPRTTPRRSVAECAEAFFAQSGQHRSAHDEDKTLFTRFFWRNRNRNNQKKRRGYYIELGAFDGRKESNTRFFDECLHWDGLLIEGNPGMYRELARNRPHAARFFGAAGCPRVGDSVDFWTARSTIGGVLALARAGKNGTTTKNVASVPCFPLQFALDTMEVPARVDFLSLDVEGAELDVLRTLNLSQTKIRVVLVEVANRLCASDGCAAKGDAIEAMLVGQGYRINRRPAVPASAVYVLDEATWRGKRAGMG